MQIDSVVTNDLIEFLTVSSRRQIRLQGDPIDLAFPAGSEMEGVAGGQKEVSGALTQAQILALNTTPITVVPAPGAAEAIVVDEVEIFHDYSTTQYAGGGDLEVEYTGSNEVVLVASTILTAASDSNVVA